MNSNENPPLVSVPFAQSGTKHTIPVPSQTGVTPGAASYTDGFPPLTFTPLDLGGVPPSGADFNGILYALSFASRWSQAGGMYAYDATFAAAIGGYPQGATLRRQDGNGHWLNLVDGNTSDPDNNGANWVAMRANRGVTSIGMAPGVVTPAVKDLANETLVLTGALSSASTLRLPLIPGANWKVLNTTSGAGTVTVQGPTGTAVSVPQGVALEVFTDGTNFYAVAAPTTGNYLPLTGTAVAAAKLAAARLISLGGVLSGGVNFDGSSDVTINAQVNDGSLSIGKTSGLQAALDGKATAGYVNAQIAATVTALTGQLYAAGFLTQRGRGVAPATGGNGTTAAVTFPRAFSAVPEVFLIARGRSQPGGPVVCELNSDPTVNGFVGYFDVAEGSGGNPYIVNPVPFSWLAFGLA